MIVTGQHLLVFVCAPCVHHAEGDQDCEQSGHTEGGDAAPEGDLSDQPEAVSLE